MSKRISVIVDAEVEKILMKHKLDGEASATCLKRLIRLGAEQSSLVTTVRSDVASAMSEMRSILQLSLAEQKATSDRFMSAVSGSLESSKLNQLSENVEQQVNNFAESVKAPFQDISKSLNDIAAQISSGSE